MSVVICPGIHDPDLTQSFLAGLEYEADKTRKPSADFNFNQKVHLLTFPSQDYAVLSAFHILQFLRDRLGNPPAPPVVFISFSAGVVGALGAAWGWQSLGGKVKAFIALDGWGVPLISNFPIYRLSHDQFTHSSSSLLGTGEDNFYADPPVAHLEMWRSPQTVEGWWVHSAESCVRRSPPLSKLSKRAVGKTLRRSRLTAAQFLTMLLELYEEI